MPAEEMRDVVAISFGTLGADEYMLLLQDEQGEEHMFRLDRTYFRGLADGVEDTFAQEEAHRE